MSNVLFPVNYKKITDIVMGKRLEDFGHHVNEKSGEEFDKTRGYTMEAYGWKMFCDDVGPFAKPYYIGNIYDAENGWGYIGDMISINGRPHPNIHSWAARTRIEFLGRGKFKIDKTEAIYDYESMDLY